MQDIRSEAAMRETLQFLAVSNIPSKHKAVLLDVLARAIRAEEGVQTAAKVAEPIAWSTEETAQLQAYLDGRVASSWQHADELLMHLATQLHRSTGDIRVKATELGLGEGVDYRLARMRPRPPID